MQPWRNHERNQRSTALKGPVLMEEHGMTQHIISTSLTSRYLSHDIIAGDILRVPQRRGRCSHGGTQEESALPLTCALTSGEQGSLQHPDGEPIFANAIDVHACNPWLGRACSVQLGKNVRDVLRMLGRPHKTESVGQAL